MARLYTDNAFLTEFLRDPEGSARAAGLPEASVQKLVHADLCRIRLAAQSFARKREHQTCRAPKK